MASPNSGHSASSDPGSNGRPKPDPAELRARMASVRSDLERDIAGVSHKVHDATHWQYYVKKFPFVCLGAAMIAGYALVPSRKQEPIALTDEQIKELADAGKLHIAPEPKGNQTASMAQQAGLALGSMVARAGLDYLGKILAQQGIKKDE
ncbi:hypothetical protein [Aeoliella sp.]|uniref:hypothetical protein n=1 Tax=Aeoliella sp. TaxID=2795800 RepID=UPI003CCC2F5F